MKYSFNSDDLFWLWDSTKSFVLQEKLSFESKDIQYFQYIFAHTRCSIWRNIHIFTCESLGSLLRISRLYFLTFERLLIIHSWDTLRNTIHNIKQLRNLSPISYCISLLFTIVALTFQHPIVLHLWTTSKYAIWQVHFIIYTIQQCQTYISLQL